MLFIKWTNPGINKRFNEILAILNSKGIINPFSSHFFKRSATSCVANLLRKWFEYQTHVFSECLRFSVATEVIS